MINNAPTSLYGLRRKLNNKQISIINFVWEYFLTYFEGVPKNVFFNKFKPDSYINAIKKLGGSIIYETYHEKYQLTYLGALLSHNGREYEELVIRYLKYVCDKFSSFPEIKTITSSEIKEHLELNEFQLFIIEKFHRVGWLHDKGGPGTVMNFNIPSDIYKVCKHKKLNTFFKKKVFNYYDPQMPIEEHLRTPYYINKTNNVALNELYGSKTASKNEFNFIDNEKLRNLLTSDWEEAKKVNQVEGWKSCIILCGGILEGLLLDILKRRKSEAFGIYNNIFEKKPKEIDQWGLGELVDVAKELEIVGKGISYLGHAVRTYRNLIHPGRQLKESIKVTPDEATIAINTVKICIHDLEKSYGSK